MEKVIISVETLNKVMQVLGEMKYAQVAGLVKEIQEGVEPISEPTTEDSGE